ncbi:DUF2333 family protein [Halomonas beimenensis]|uniref:DUF2333 family protein n=1 Tax=Halomonas beimenensis TaxID=475662 RepID=UPI0031E08817
MVLKRKSTERRRKRVEALERPQYGWIWKPLLALAGLYLLVALGLGVWWSRTPPAFEVEAVAEHPGGADAGHGAATLASLMALVETLLDKPGGYLRNDIAPPGLWLDNMPAWELGVLSQARRLSGALPAMTGDDAVALARVQEQLAGDSTDWFYPSTEHRLEQALIGLEGYLGELSSGEAAFGDPGQGVAPWLSGVARGLDDLGRRLSASVGSPEALADLDLEAEGLPRETPWYRVDNVFFEARGQTWALRQLLVALRHDLADALEDAGELGRWEALVAELERSQRRLWSPVVLNGSGFGIFANHSLVMANHVLRARDLTRELAQALSRPSAPETVAEGAAEEAPAAPAESQAAPREDAEQSPATPEAARREGEEQAPAEPQAAPQEDTEQSPATPMETTEGVEKAPALGAPEAR